MDITREFRINRNVLELFSRCGVKFRASDSTEKQASAQTGLTINRRAFAFRGHSCLMATKELQELESVADTGTSRSSVRGRTSNGLIVDGEIVAH